MRKIKYVIFLSLLMGGVAQAQITYVDAIVESSVGTPNTVATSGASTNVWYEPNGGFSFTEKWARRTDPAFGNGPGDDILQARNTVNAFEELTTTISGLTSGKYYRVYAFFWDAGLGNVPDTQTWSLDAGLVSSNLTAYHGQSDTEPFNADGYASNLTFTTSLLTVSANRELLYADVGWIQVDASGEIKVYIDNSLEANNGNRSWYDGVGYEEIEKPQFTVIWEDNFASIYNGKHIEWQNGWTANALDGGWAGTNSGAMVQRPNASTNATGKGFGGAVRDDNPLQPEADESMVVKFDWTMYTDGLSNNSYMDLAMATNVVMETPYHAFPMSLTSTNTAMGFRISYNVWPGPGDGQSTSNGTIQVIFADNTVATYTNHIDPSVLGLAPTDGDDVSDLIEVTYSLEKTATTNVWIASLMLTNTATSAGVATEQTVVNATWYNNQDFYFAQYANSALAGDGVGNVFDNFQGLIRGPAPPTGWEGFVDEYGLTGIATDDFDGDGKTDLYEYGLGGVPTNALDTGNQPYLVYGSDDNVRHYHYELSDINRGISYEVGMREDLTAGTWTIYSPANPGWWNGSSTNSSVVTNSIGVYDEVMRRFWGGTGAPDDNFVRLIISLDP